MSLDWALFEQQLLQEDGSIVIVFKNKENGKDPQQIHIRTIYVSVMLISHCSLVQKGTFIL